MYGKPTEQRNEVLISSGALNYMLEALGQNESYTESDIINTEIGFSRVKNNLISLCSTDAMWTYGDFIIVGIVEDVEKYFILTKHSLAKDTANLCLFM